MRLFLVCFGALLLCVGASAHRGASHLITDEIPFKINWPGEHFTLVNQFPQIKKINSERRFQAS